MPVTFGGAIAGSYGGDAAKPTGLSNGDIWAIFVGGFYAATTTAATASGFEVVGGAGFAGHATDNRLSGTWLAKPVTNAAGEPSTVSITPGGGVGDMIPISFYVRGASSVSIADAVAGVSSARTAAGAANQVNLPSVSVGRDGSLAAIGEVAWQFDQWHSAGEPVGFDALVTYGGSEVNDIGATSNVNNGAAPAPTIIYTVGGGATGGTGDGLVAMVVFQPAAAGGAASDSTESSGRRQLRRNAIYRMSPRSEREAQQFLRAQRRAYGFAPLAA